MYYRERTALVVERLNHVGAKHGLGRLCADPDGTFYVWADLSAVSIVFRVSLQANKQRA